MTEADAALQKAFTALAPYWPGALAQRHNFGRLRLPANGEPIAPDCPTCGEMMPAHGAIYGHTPSWRLGCDRCNEIARQAKRCPHCGKTMAERPVTDKDGKIIGKQFVCVNPKCPRKGGG